MNNSATANVDNSVLEAHTPTAHQRERLQIVDDAATNPKVRPLVTRFADGIADMVKNGGPRPATYAALAEWFANVSKARTEGLLSEADMEDLRLAFGPAVVVK